MSPLLIRVCVGNDFAKPGPITLEIINFGVADFLLHPSMYICQLIIEEVRGSPTDAPNQFKGQINPVGGVPMQTAAKTAS